MKHTEIFKACRLVLGTMAGIKRSITKDVAFTYRMGAGFPGDVNRTHPASILPGLINTTNPPLLYGNPVLVASNSYRQILTSDTAVTAIAGVLVRPFPVQQTTGGMNATLGAATPPTSGVCDVIDSGFVLVRSNDFAANPPVKGGTVYVWVAASSGVHVQGGFETISSGSTITLTNARYNGPADSNGICEIKVWNA